jgi:glyoxylase-like metal-dependent hydrolase (beta-lactamase superfamily II)
MFVSCVLLIILFNSVSSSKTITLESLIVTQVQDAISPNENSNAYIVTSTNSHQGFFVDTGATNSTTFQLISIYQQQVQSTSKPPQFVFLTHGHPDHTGGIAIIQQTYPTTPIYVISQQIVREAIQWTGFSCSNNLYSAAQCAVNYTSVLRVLTSPRSQLAFDHPSVQLSVFSNVVKGESSYAGLLGLNTLSGAYLLFTADAITIRSHLFVSNFFDTQTLPGSDDALCAWAGSMQASVCNLQLSNRQSMILPGHGPISNATNFVSDVAQNIAWLRTLRNLTFNSCNASYIWAEIVRQYPDFTDASLGAKGVLNTHVPADANSVNCNCNNGSPTICPVYNAPPSCLHLDISDEDTTLACNMRTSMSSIDHQSLMIPMLLVLPFVSIFSF